ncbi:MAG: D-alanyl-D-alanine carboxypeptidase [Clostridia bacterium]|nr:D-alanyl-D-alanine carboxypeptidase [Clostridia bacterium]
MIPLCLPLSVSAEETPPSSIGAPDDSLALNCKSAVLMEAHTGTVLYAQNAAEALPPASVTKIMTLLLVMEALDAGKFKLSDLVTASENAASMGGSQVYLKVGETMTVEDMIKSVVISSANDAAVALAEFVSGDVSTFVRQMNERAKELGMDSTVFENVTGLDDTAEHHLTSAMDIARMSRALIAHPTVLKYSSIWMDTIRGGAFGLTNTNRLIRFYRGATGLKTGSTSKAGFCVSVTAERDGLSLICVIMGAETRDIRNAQATRLLDWGFANYTAYVAPEEALSAIPVTGGTSASVPAVREELRCVLPRDEASRVECRMELPERVDAPITRGDVLGKAIYLVDGKTIGEATVTAAQDVERIGFFEFWRRLSARILLAAGV